MFRCTYHGWSVVKALPPFNAPRCWYCGHRLPVLGVQPVATRKLPLRYWFSELVARSRARNGVPDFLTTTEWDAMMFGTEAKEEVTRIFR